MNNNSMKFDLEDRLVRFSGEIINFITSIKNDLTGKTLSGQIVRSATSSALNYGEAQAAESRRDFIHKNKIVLKELKETRVNLKIITYVKYGDESNRITLLNECEELIAIFATIIKKCNQK